MSIVIGLGFGDEGKGLATSWLCSRTHDPMVVRFNGGHQAGHTVVWDGHRHVFSNFGSGTLQGAPTYWAEKCTIHPVGMLNEATLLKEHQLYVHPLCPVTTPFDIWDNHGRELKEKHGTVGVGFGSTIQRQENYYKLHAMDLFHDDVLRHKLDMIVRYYGKGNLYHIEEFITQCHHARQLFEIADYSILDDKNLIFEGAQGVMLDMDHGFFPHVTRSNTTSKNALAIGLDDVDILYVTRAYHTRHGNGPLPGECELTLENNQLETNVDTGAQGKFRKAPLNIGLLKYAIACDDLYSKGRNKNLLITCCDQLRDVDPYKIASDIGVEFNRVYMSNGPHPYNVSQLHYTKKEGRALRPAQLSA